MAPAPTKTPGQAASSAATARSQRRSVRATSWRRGPPPPVGTGARIAEGAGLGPGALTLAPGGRYRPLVVRFSGCTRNIRARTARIAIVQMSDFKVGTMSASDRVVIGDGDIPLRRLCGALAEAGYDGWYDIELLGPAIEAEGYEAVVPRAIARFRGLWT